MNRREFLKTSAALLALGLLPACKKPEKDKIIFPSGSLTYREFPKIGAKISLLGFGLMRLPRTGDGQIDKEKALALVDRAMKAGINYYDTAWFYHGGLSEDFAGEALSRYKRESFYLATKLPVHMIESRAQAEEIFAKQLGKCKTTYFDFYLIHNLSGPTWKKSLANGAVEFALSLKKKGVIKRIGFSYHGENKDFPEILNYHPWDFVQIQANYYDWDNYSKELYDWCAEKNIPVVIMEPLRGGELVNLPKEAADILQEAKPNSTPAEWAFRFIASQPNVMTVLSGMTQMEHLEENLKTFSPLKPLSETEAVALNDALKIYRSGATIPCTGCRYCMPCPVGVAIPDVFKAYNDSKVAGDKMKARLGYQKIPAEARADNCVNCKACLSKCPQKIDIPEELKRADRVLSRGRRI